MAVKSAINPGAIANSKPIRVSAAQNFITGGTPLGESVLTSAANKIVGFQRGAAQVSARPPDLGSIINTLSSSIISNVENRLQSVNQNVVNIVNNKLQGIETDYAGRISKLDPDNQPSNILKNFLNLYKEAIGYIQFLGNKKNVKTLGDNLTTLQNIFKETFDVAKIIRQTIVKIVGQLSNLPSASGGGGGLNLDIDVPGGPLKRTAPRGIAKLGKMALAGTAIAGAGALGTKVVSGMMDVGGGDVQPTPTGDVSGGLSGPMLDRFNNILDRFSSAIANFKPPKQETSAQKPSTAAPTNNEPPPDTGPGGPATMPNADQDLYTLATIAGLESGTAQGQSDVAQAVYNRMEKNGKTATQILTSRGQFEPAFTAPFKISGGTIDPEAQKIKTFDDAVKYRMKKTGEKKESAEASIKSTISNLQNQQLQQSSSSFIGSRTSFRGSPQNVGKLSNTIWRGSRSDNQFLNEEVSSKTAAVPAFVSGKGKSGTIVTQITPGKSQVQAAPTQSTTAQQVSQQVAQQPGANQPSQPLMVPINLTNQQPQQQTQPSPPPPPPIISNDGTKIPNIGSTNFDNFLTLYSRITYNVVES